MVNINNKKVGTLGEFLKNGWSVADFKYQRGYMSRKSVVYDDAVYIVEHGRRKGEYFALRPCYISTRYCFRVYLTKLPTSNL